MLNRNLALITEEAGEVLQLVGKTYRFGPDSYKPSDPNQISNRELLILECMDLYAVLHKFLTDEGVDSVVLDEHIALRTERELEYRNLELLNQEAMDKALNG